MSDFVWIGLDGAARTVEPAELLELRAHAAAYAPPAPAPCHCDQCEAMRREIRRAPAPSRNRVDVPDVSDDAFARFLPY